MTGQVPGGDGDGDVESVEYAEIVIRVSDVPESAAAPDGHLPRVTGLAGISPNPFNPSTEIAFTLAAEERTRLAVYDLRGRVVAELADRVYPRGRHVVTWNGKGSEGQTLPSGVHVARLEAGAHVETRTMSLVK